MDLSFFYGFFVIELWTFTSPHPEIDQQCLSYTSGTCICWQMNELSSNLQKFNFSASGSGAISAKCIPPKYFSSAYWV